MEVVEPPPSFTYEFECMGCRAKLVAGAEDVSRGNFGVKDERSVEYYVTCPACDTQHVIRRQDVPLHVRQLADKKSDGA